jgi:sortase A
VKLGNRFTIAGCLVKTDRLLLILGIALLGIYFGALLHARLFSHFALWRFEEVVAAAQRPPDQPSSPSSKDDVDVSRWAKGRLQAYESSLANKLPDPIAVLTIRRLHLRVPIFDGTDEVTLNRGIGRIPGTAMPGEDGNLAIAGHRDGFFRGLKDIAIGDQVEIRSPGESETYIVDSTEIVTPDDVRVLEGGPIHTVTLITCYPFYFVGDAPKRFIVKASVIHRSELQETRALRQEPQNTGQAKQQK